jgi:hypothetical protein
MKNKLLFILFFAILSCSKNKILKTELNKIQIIPSGEWISAVDSASGLSVRKDRIAFYNNNKFNSEDIAKYRIIDSIEMDDNNKKILGTYLIADGIDDTIVYKITNRNNKSISIELKNGRIDEFKLEEK